MIIISNNNWLYYGPESMMQQGAMSNTQDDVCDGYLCHLFTCLLYIYHEFMMHQWTLVHDINCKQIALAGISIPTKTRLEKPGPIEVTHVAPQFNTPFTSTSQVKYIDRSVENPSGRPPMRRSSSMKCPNRAAMRDYDDSLACIIQTEKNYNQSPVTCVFVSN